MAVLALRCGCGDRTHRLEVAFEQEEYHDEMSGDPCCSTMADDYFEQNFGNVQHNDLAVSHEQLQIEDAVRRTAPAVMDAQTGSNRGSRLSSILPGTVPELPCGGTSTGVVQPHYGAGLYSEVGTRPEPPGDGRSKEAVPHQLGAGPCLEAHIPSVQESPCGSPPGPVTCQ